eukprot:COSAG01_NODE_1429_length_10330_cov_4.369759_9_plen_570_part_00
MLPAAAAARRRPRSSKPKFTSAYDASQAKAAGHSLLVDTVGQRLLRADAKNSQRAEALRRANRLSGSYGNFWADAMRSAVRAYTRERRGEVRGVHLGEGKAPAGSRKPTSLRQLELRWAVPYSSLNNLCHRAMGTGPYAPGGKMWEQTEGEQFEWDEDRLYASAPGRQPIVPEEISRIIAGFFALSADKTGIGHGRDPETLAEGGRLLVCQLDFSEVDYPVAWAMRGGPGADWWRRFFETHTCLSTGYARMIDVARLAAHTPAAIKDWCGRVLGTNAHKLNEDGTGWHGLNPEGMEKYLKSEMTEFVTAAKMTDAQIKLQAFELCHSPRKQSCFDQKGHALGGGGNMQFVGVKGERKECMDTPDSDWLSMCTLVFGDGVVGFNAFVKQGKLKIHEESTPSPPATPPTSPAVPATPVVAADTAPLAPPTASAGSTTSLAQEPSSNPGRFFPSLTADLHGDADEAAAADPGKPAPPPPSRRQSRSLDRYPLWSRHHPRHHQVWLQQHRRQPASVATRHGAAARAGALAVPLHMLAGQLGGAHRYEVSHLVLPQRHHPHRLQVALHHVGLLP